jgi:hypothetical protein
LRKVHDKHVEGDAVDRGQFHVELMISSLGCLPWRLPLTRHKLGRVRDWLYNSISCAPDGIQQAYSAGYRGWIRIAHPPTW